MHTTPEIKNEEFEKLLLWLDRDRESAGRTYEQIRLRLIKIFYARKCHLAEELADETINRVTKKAASLLESYEGEPALYFFAVARNVYLEFTRRPKTVEIPVYIQAQESSNALREANYECFSYCLQRLDSEERDLILRYHQSEKHAKTDSRQNLALQFGVSLENLRVRVYRTRRKLQICFRSCIAAKSSD
jgi:RNA polymerase sigma factor (sigma-70 family)